MWPRPRWPSCNCSACCCCSACLGARSDAVATRSTVRMDRRPTAREVALEVLHRVDADRAWSGAALRAALGRAGLAPADEALATELVYGTLRHRAQVDWAL